MSSVFPPGLLDPPKKPVRRHYSFAVLSPVVSVGAIALLVLFSMLRAYDPAPAKTYPLSNTLDVPTGRELVLSAANGRPFARRGGCLDAPITVNEIPDHFLDALLAIEDRRFFEHFGIDPVGIARAAFTNVNAGKIVQGGSTITQQLAKISYLSSEKSFDRKVKEAIAVLRLEGVLTKHEILERYLNRAYFGEGCFGLRAAARHYFKRKVADLTLPESATLVALLKSPTQLAHDDKALRQRETLVLDAMVDFGRLDPETRKAMKRAKRRTPKASSFGAFYADWIADTVDIPDDGSREPLPIKTSFEPGLQRIAEQSVRKILGRYGRSRRASQAALVVMRPDGRVLAMVGGRNYRRSQFNRASQALRQPGSSFKAFVYLAALRAGAHPEMMVSDAPITIGNWSPQNYSKRYRGIVPLRRAFSSSLNTVAVRLTQAVGPGQVAKAARDLGISTPIIRGNHTIALGTFEVTLLELTAAYAAFAANAYPVRPWGVLSAGKPSSGQGRPPSDAGRWKLMQGEAMRRLLAATVQAGTGRAARLPIQTFGKTGTSQNYRDAWFIGFAGNLVVGVWVGNDDNTRMRRVTGGNLPALIWKDFMSKAQRKDKRFDPDLPTVAAFKAQRPKRARNRTRTAALRSILIKPSAHRTVRWRSSPMPGNVAAAANVRRQIVRYGCHLPQYARSVPGCRALHARVRTLQTGIKPRRAGIMRSGQAARAR